MERPITPRQIALVEQLLAERQHAYPDDFSVSGWTARQGSALIEALFSMPLRSGVAPARRANSYPGKCADCKGAVAAEEGWISKEGGRWLTRHHTCPEAPAAEEVITEDGMYRTPDGTIYKVQVAVHGSGNLYAKRMVELEHPRLVRGKEHRFDFVYDAGAISKLRPEWRMSLEEAVAFGQLYGCCCRCGATLTDDSPGGSIERGIGPVCATKGWA